MDEYFLFEAPAEEELSDDEDEVDFSLVDVTAPSMSPSPSWLPSSWTPFVVLCREDCKGLCPTCGSNLNEGDCGCAAKREAEKLAESPFAGSRTKPPG